MVVLLQMYEARGIAAWVELLDHSPISLLEGLLLGGPEIAGVGNGRLMCRGAACEELVEEGGCIIHEGLWGCSGRGR